MIYPVNLLKTSDLARFQKLKSLMRLSNLLGRRASYESRKIENQKPCERTQYVIENK
jgi:hypothetical protein